MSTNVTFYAVNQDGLFGWTAKLVERAVTTGRKVFILCSHQEQAQALDDYLWTYQEEAFVPHAIIDSPTSKGAKVTPAVLATTPWQPEGATILVQLSAGEIEFGLQFSHVVELVDRENEDQLKLSRDRYRSWKKAAQTQDVTVEFKG